MIKKYLNPKSSTFLLALICSLFFITACETPGECDGVTNCSESFILTETPNTCCFRVDTEDLFIFSTQDVSIDLNEDGLDDVLFDGEDTGGGPGGEQEITLRPQNGTEILVDANSDIKTFVDQDEMITANETFENIAPLLVRVSGSNIINNWPTGAALSIMGLKIPIQGSTTEFDYAYICMRVDPSQPMVEIAYFASQIGI